MNMCDFHVQNVNSILSEIPKQLVGIRQGSGRIPRSRRLQQPAWLQVGCRQSRSRGWWRWPVLESAAEQQLIPASDEQELQQPGRQRVVPAEQPDGWKARAVSGAANAIRPATPVQGRRTQAKSVVPQQPISVVSKPACRYPF